MCLLESQLKNERLFSLVFSLLDKMISEFFMSCLKLIIHVRHLVEFSYLKKGAISVPTFEFEDLKSVLNSK